MSTSTSTSVYVTDKDHGWLPANVVSYEGDVAKVTVSVPGSAPQERDVKLSDYPGNSLPLQNVNEGGDLITMKDMCDLPSLHEAAILYNLKARHEATKPYTRVGEIVIAVNPFQWIDGLYADETREEYVDKLIWNQNVGDGDAKSGLDPHVYETSSLAYRGLAVDGHHQSILVSGESGAGKTETVKIVMSHLASIESSEMSLKAPTTEETEHICHTPRASAVVRRVLDSNPLLEAFGNAKTVRNDNSSRFGKYIQLQFDVEDATAAAFTGRSVPACVLAGSMCETYLLEKSRVVGHETKERTYHIFYELIAAPEEFKKEVWDGLANTNNSSFAYVGDTNTTTIEGRTDAARWERTKEALSTIGVTDDRLSMLMRAVATVMQLGNLTFDADPTNDDLSIISDTNELARLASLMGVATDDIQKSLTNKTVVAGKELYVVPLKVDDARDSRDAFAKEIYQQIFDWLVRTINEATSADSNYKDAAQVDEFGLIGLLDIFGFESFTVNRFEQLCINYCNEKLQQKYTLDIFRSVQEEYEYEGIELGEVSFADNADVLNLVEGRMGIISVLNEECVRPKGNDSTFVSKVKTVNKDIECLIQEKLHRPTEFAISHYAGPVKYDAENFVQKNNDALPNDLLECACKSTNELISQELKAAAEAKLLQAQSARGKASRMTVATKFRTQLSSLMHEIGKTRTRYIRCIKPNPEKEPVKMNLLSSAEQLRCAGVVAAVTISRVAFPNRLMHESALERFRCLASTELKHNMDVIQNGTASVDVFDLKESVESLLGELLKDLRTTSDAGVVTEAFSCGKSRVYFRNGALEHLESERMVALGVLATSIERIVRGFTARSIYLGLKSKSIFAQAICRRTLARNAFLRSKNASTALSCWVRYIFAGRELVRLRREKACVLLQTRCRIFQAMAMFSQSRLAATTIQKVARGAQQRPIYQTLLKEAKEEAKVNSKLAQLQKRLADAEMKLIQADRKRIEAEKRAAGTAPPLEEKQEPEEEKKADEETEQQKDVIHESGEMLQFMQKEIFKLKSTNYLLRTELAEVKAANQELVEHNTSAAASFEALKQHANQLSETNLKLIVKNSAQKGGLADVKKELTSTKFKHKAEISTIKTEMRAKEALYESEIAKLKMELERVKDKENPIELLMSASYDKPTRASFDRGASFHRSTSPSVDTEEEWGHDGYFTLYGNNARGGHQRTRRGQQRPSPRHPQKPLFPPARKGGTSLQRHAYGRRTPPATVRSRGPSPTTSLAAAATGNPPAVPKVSSSSSLAAAAATASPSAAPATKVSSADRTSPNSSLASAASKTSSLSKAAAPASSSLARAGKLKK